MFLTLLLSVIAGCLKFLFLLGDFLVQIWLLYALLLFNLPVAVGLKRFAAELFVFILGITVPSCISFHFLRAGKGAAFLF